jgi:hypothetical protein
MIASRQLLREKAAVRFLIKLRQPREIYPIRPLAIQLFLCGPFVQRLNQ